MLHESHTALKRFEASTNKHTRHKHKLTSLWLTDLWGSLEAMGSGGLCGGSMDLTLPAGCS